MLKKITIDPPLSGLTNMERDKNNFHFFEENQERGFIIRIYEWLTPTISLGTSQKKDFLKNNFNLEVVKRITGGKAVLHYQEITYSIISDLNNHFLGGGLYESYNKISALLVSFLKSKIKGQEIKQVEIQEKSNSPICYLTKGFKEICINGRKLIGSAQKRGKYAFLQHGSIPCLRHQLALENFLNQGGLPENNYIFLSDYIEKIDLAKLKLEIKAFWEKKLKNKV